MAQAMSTITLDAPPSDNTVRVRMIDTTVIMSLHSEMFIKPVMPGHEIMNGPDVAFLIENERLGKKAMFDLGTRKDYWNSTPRIQTRLDNIAVGLRIDKDVKDILLENDISLESINSIIWSHSHWDHVGDTTLFPQSTTLVYGEGIKKMGPFYPTNPDSPLHTASFENRHNQTITFPANSPKIGNFPAHDFFGDGSFYLLDTPGHAAGHMCGLARTTPTTFILMGGDVCHFAGDMRPSKEIPMPDPIPSGILHHRTNKPPHPCPCSYFLDEHPQFQSQSQQPHQQAQPSNNENEIPVLLASKEAKQTHAAHLSKTTRSTTPYYKLSTSKTTVYETPSTEVAQATVDNLSAQFDSAGNVLVCLAHDPSLLDHLPTLNAQPDQDLNDWLAKGYKEKCHWGWLNEVPKQGEPGRGQIVDGWYRDGKKYKTAKEMIDSNGGVNKPSS